MENGFLVENFLDRGKCLLLISRGGAQVIFLLKHSVFFQRERVERKKK